MITTFSITPRGVLVYAPVIKRRNGDTVLLLSCSTIDKDGIKRRLTVLLEKHHVPGEAPLDQPLYRIVLKDQVRGLSGQLGPRVMLLDPVQAHPQVARDPWPQDTLTPSWQRVYIVARPEQRADPSLPVLDSLRCFTNTLLPPPFRFPLATCKMFVSHKPFRIPMTLDTIIQDVPEPWTSDSPPVVIVFRLLGNNPKFLVIKVGVCNNSVSSMTRGDGLGGHWATVQVYSVRPTLMDSHGARAQQLRSHSCPGDHIIKWPTLKRTFQGAGNLLPYGNTESVLVTLLFARCPMNPQSTLVLKRFDTVCIEPVMANLGSSKYFQGLKFFLQADPEDTETTPDTPYWEDFPKGLD